VSRLSAELRIALLPAQAAMSDGKGRFETEDSDRGWKGSLSALAKLLTSRRGSGPAAVVLSQHFARLFLLPAPAAWLSSNEMQTWLADQLRVPLDGVEKWQMQWQNSAPGSPVLVCAVERALLEELHATLAQAGIKPRTIQPWQAVAFNRHEPALSHATGWYAVLEPGIASLMRIERGRITALRQRQLGPDPAVDLRNMIGREALINGVSTPGELWLDSGGVQAPWREIAQPDLTVHELPTADSLPQMMLAP
jgi:hypothetical protein